MTTPAKLAQFDGRDVIGTTISVMNAGDGLSAALAIDPREMHHGEIIHVVLRCHVSKVTHTPVKDTDALLRGHTLSAGLATIVDAKLVAKVLDAQADKIEKAAGVDRLPGMSREEIPGDPEKPETKPRRVGRPKAVK